ncbi:MAG: hypothetical protein ACO1SV_16270 [Fimbriimonas sp.]
MKILKKLAALAVPVLLAVLIGCGGGGSSRGTGGSPDALTRQQVKNGFGMSLIALAQSGMMPGAGSTAGTSGGSTGSAGSVPFVGAFVRQFLPGIGRGVETIGTRVSTTGDSGTGGSTSSGGGGEEPPPIYFDEYLGLWVEWVSTDNQFSTLLFEDEAKTKPAGSFDNTFDFDGNYTSTFEITAGPFAGAHGRYETTVAGDGESGETTYDNTWPTWGHDEGSATWGPNGSEWHHRSDMPDGSWYQSQGAFGANGGGSASGSDSLGYRYEFTYNENGSGKGRVEGPQSGLPCTITWRADGFTRIVWADGTVEEYDPNDWFGEGGTTGSVGGTSSTGVTPD